MLELPGSGGQCVVSGGQLLCFWDSYGSWFILEGYPTGLLGFGFIPLLPSLVASLKPGGADGQVTCQERGERLFAKTTRALATGTLILFVQTGTPRLRVQLGSFSLLFNA